MTHESVDRLFKEALFYQLLQNKNPYITCETLVGRVMKNISKLAGLPVDECTVFKEIQEEIRISYEKIRKTYSIDEQICVERILAREDVPHVTELIRFANCWYKHDPLSAQRWFAVDGTLGEHPKNYVHEAFAPVFEKHNAAVRFLYQETESFEEVSNIVREAFAQLNGENFNPSPLLDRYFEMAGDGKSAFEERSLKRHSKRKRSTKNLQEA